MAPRSAPLLFVLLATLAIASHAAHELRGRGHAHRKLAQVEGEWTEQGFVSDAEIASGSIIVVGPEISGTWGPDGFVADSPSSDSGFAPTQLPSPSTSPVGGPSNAVIQVGTGTLATTPPTTFCGNGICQPPLETFSSCPQDCPAFGGKK